jgi:hypothetical protein
MHAALVKSDRAADTLKKFLEHSGVVDSVARIVKNYRSRVMFLQRLARKLINVRAARLVKASSVLSIMFKT